jgi:four helix bundle protein
VPLARTVDERLNSKDGSGMNRRVETFRDLDVYQEACSLDLKIHELTKKWPKEEMYALTDQVRRSSRSVGANIAEAWAKKRYPAHFTSKLTDADAELQETQHWLLRAKDYGYLEVSQFEELWEKSQLVGRRLGSMLKAGNW